MSPPWGIVSLANDHFWHEADVSQRQLLAQSGLLHAFVSARTDKILRIAAVGGVTYSCSYRARAPWTYIEDRPKRGLEEGYAWTVTRRRSWETRTSVPTRASALAAAATSGS